MIRIFLGNVGSGKTISIIKELKDGLYNVPTYSNIITKQKGKYSLKQNRVINRDMLVEKTVTKIKRDGTPEYKLKFNATYWKDLKKDVSAFNVVIDEAHTLLNARNFMSKTNRVMNDFLSLIRKICSDPNHDSTLTLISQLDNRVDLNAREMATEVRYHLGLYDKVCSSCKAYWSEHSELPDYQKPKRCPYCNSHNLKKFNHSMIVHYFSSIKQYQDWKYNGMNTILKTVHVKNISEYFPYYDTFQLDDLISEED